MALAVEAPLVLIARKDLPVKDMKEFVAYAKANGAKMQYASAGTGSAIHLGCALVNMVAGIDVVHVPYRGANPAMQDLISGRVDYLCDIITTAKPQIDAGTVKPIAILTKARSPVLPDVPTAIEQGFDVDAYTWNAFFLPKGTPDADRAKAQPCDGGGDEDAGGTRETGKRRAPVRFRRSHDAGISRQIRAERDRQMGGADQGRRHQRGLERDEMRLIEPRRDGSDWGEVNQKC